MTLFDRVDDLVEQGRPASMLTIVDKDGSAPRDVGAKMLVTDDDEYGTIGGGTVEGLAVEDSRDVLRGDADPGVRTYELRPGGNTGMVCGGSMDVFIDRIRGRARLYVAGGGHIGVELAAMGTRLGYAVTVVDDREEYASPERFSADVDVVHGPYDEVLAGLPMTSETAVVVATRSGTFDRQAVAAALNGGAGYVGVVASEDKTAHIFDSLLEDGYSRRDLVRVRAPVGLDLGGGGPEDVVLSILAELHRDRYDATGERANRHDIDDLVVLRGGGDLGSGVVYRLHQAGFPVIVTETAQPTVVRRAVAFGAAMYDGDVTVQGVTGRRVADVDEALAVLADDEVPVLEDPDGTVIDELEPRAVVDAIMAKGKFDTGTRRALADVVVGLGPGFDASENVDAVVETDRGHELGHVIYDGKPSPYDGEPGDRRGYTHERVLRAPSDGVWSPSVEIGEVVEAETIVGSVDDDPVVTEIGGLVRGLVHDGVSVSAGAKLGDVDPRDDVDYTKISDKALCLGGGVLEALLKLS
ncbi:selenium-dependent molybdenum cofactor biosynthesis protein YqeB [Natrinema gelatinilyticum]|uniref:selenium-dependent molybdenum cofactor biosynthesis protein YqeB n=1 Tax=Natrinema gelatinilyticum TaxID=2961571 RepID=UPI0020C3C14C|nr:selenium-dependent molybdenum cofactor biosynthesis protein YqeB [Natrinema gelatinilyticum]